MTYFPHRNVEPRKCPGCGGMYIDTGFRCAVAHAPGTCCHYGDITEEGWRIGPDGRAFKEQA